MKMPHPIKLDPILETTVRAKAPAEIMTEIKEKERREQERREQEMYSKNPKFVSKLNIKRQ